ncbi:MAG: GspE/PulE family protein [Clostridia bacterium]
MLRINFITSLQTKGIITTEQLDTLVSYIKEHNANEMQAIVHLSLLDNYEVAQAVAKRYSLKFISLKDYEPSKIIDFTAERLYDLGAVPFEIVDKVLKVALVDPTDTSPIEILTAVTGYKIEPYVALRLDINNFIEKAFGTKTDEEDDGLVDADIVLLVQKWLAQAVRVNASDIHIEGINKKLRVRFRVDGVLREYSQYPIEWHNSIISRIKILGEMDIAEKRMPQDGKFTDTIDRNEYDFRVSILPTVLGEKCVLRIAPKRIVFSTKAQLGLLNEDVEKFERIFTREHGMVLVSGPTGCGKTTTLYSMLSEINSIEKNTITVEDPVEISISGINQVQATAGLSFSNALRSILRQDPDIIMIGEIRDTETAKMAIQASVTGHLVLSTLHTNSSANAINRLINMGVERYLISDALTSVISQRLVRKLCPHCKKEVKISKTQADRLSANNTKIYEKCGCEQCGHSGYIGRTSVFEILEIDDDMRHMINLEDFDTNSLHNYAVENGMSTLEDRVKGLVLSGVTSYEECIKICSDKEILCKV